LRALGTVAATVGQTIFLERPVDRSPGALGVIAHELVHVASGDTGGAPRLFDDPHLDDEERHARRVGSLVRALVGDEVGDGEHERRLLAAMPPPPRGSRVHNPEPSGTGLTPVLSPPVGPGGDVPVSREHDAVLADLQALYARSTSLPQGSSSLSQELSDARVATRAAPAMMAASESPGSTRRRGGEGFGIETGGGRVVDEAGPVRPSSAPQAEEFLDWLVEQVERRLARELDARGLRHRPDVL